MDVKAQLKETVDCIRGFTKSTPAVGIILGTGLGALVKEIQTETAIPYEKITHFPLSTVESHAGKLLFGKLGGKDVVAMQGRFHYYEGYTLEQVTFPVRVMKELGVKTLIVSNACGGMNPQFTSGELVLITDHINLQGTNPLIGHNDDKMGARFPDMFNCYDKELRNLAEAVALEEKVPLQKGVYLAVSGPTFETAAEYRAFRIMGADMVGMSTVPEVIVARHQGTRVLGFSLVTDMGLPDAMEPCSHERVMAAANRAEPKLTKLVKKIVERMNA